MKNLKLKPLTILYGYKSFIDKFKNDNIISLNDISINKKNELLSDHYIYTIHGDLFIKNKTIKYNKVIQEWKNIIKNKLKSKINNKSNLFDIIAKSVKTEHKNIIKIEYPENYLFHDIQVLLADYFISLALSNRNLLIETHSDHIINRIVWRFTEDSENIIRDLVKIYFMNRTNKIIEVKFDEYGYYDNANKLDGFCDQTAIDQGRIIMSYGDKRKFIES